jgi:hypothetical protein
MATSTSVSADQDRVAPAGLGSAMGGLLEAGLHRVNENLERKTQRWVGNLDRAGNSVRGSAERAGYQGVKAKLQGRNAIWAAMKGAWAGSSSRTKLVAVLVLCLLLVLSPVLTVVLILGVLATLCVEAVRSASR